MGDAFTVPFILSCSQPIRARGIIVKYLRFITKSPFPYRKRYIYTCKLNNFNPVLQVYIQTVMDSMNLKKRLHLTITISILCNFSQCPTHGRAYALIKPELLANNTRNW